jgi:hypothetical protein
LLIRALEQRRRFEDAVAALAKRHRHGHGETAMDDLKKRFRTEATTRGARPRPPSPPAMRPLPARGVALGFLILLAPSCRWIVGIGPLESNTDAGDAAGGATGGADASPDGGGDAGQPTLVGGLPIGGATAACAPCVMLKCLDQATACGADDVCRDVYACLWSCADGDLACLTFCELEADTANPNAQASLAQLDRCLQTWCSDECTPGPWDCVGNVKWTYPAAIPPTITVTASLYDNDTALALPGAIVRLCAVTDTSCDAPLAESPPADSNGTAVLTLDTSGAPIPSPMFLDIREPGYVDYLMTLDAPPLFVDLQFFTGLQTVQDLSLLAQGLGVAYDPTRPVITGVVQSCMGGEVATTDIQLDTVPSDAETAVAFTTESSDFVIVNALGPRGKAEVYALLRATGQEVAWTTVVTRAGAISHGVAVPRP